MLLLDSSGLMDRSLNTEEERHRSVGKVDRTQLVEIMGLTREVTRVTRLLHQSGRNSSSTPLFHSSAEQLTNLQRCSRSSEIQPYNRERQWLFIAIVAHE